MRKRVASWWAPSPRHGATISNDEMSQRWRFVGYTESDLNGRPPASETNMLLLDQCYETIAWPRGALRPSPVWSALLK